MAVGTVASGGTTRPWARIKAILGGSAGNLVEWYDWFAYTSTSLYFAKHFFPDENPVGQQLQTAAIFAAGFIARPLGAWLMGMYADRVGRPGSWGCTPTGSAAARR
jgi:MFS transporter, MHS family, alpha-ketoglutarate permease